MSHLFEGSKCLVGTLEVQKLDTSGHNGISKNIIITRRDSPVDFPRPVNWRRKRKRQRTRLPLRTRQRRRDLHGSDYAKYDPVNYYGRAYNFLLLQRI